MKQITIGNARISLVAKQRNDKGRTPYHYSITIDGQRYEWTDLHSGCQGGDETEGMNNLLSFLSACGESYRYPNGENADLFPPFIAEWTSLNTDEIDSHRSDLTMTAENGTELTQEQAEAIERIKPRWHSIGEPQPTIGMNGAVAVECFYSSGNSIWVAIETDGYTHS